MAVISLRQLRHKRFNCRLPVSEEKVTYPLSLFFYFILPFIKAFCTFIALLFSFYIGGFVFVCRPAPPLSANVFLPPYTHAPALSHLPLTSSGWPIGFEGGISYGNITDLPHPAAVQQFNSPYVFSFFFPPPCLTLWFSPLKKRAANLATEDVIAIMSAVALHITQCTDCSIEEEGAKTVCSVQTPHNIIIA
ncbi:hypothetical protein NQZ68_028362 [Dissostichus eleginoides]|nr:hypothetical protein NQZ68_028362 [Dissostichus eleginoides]